MEVTKLVKFSPNRNSVFDCIKSEKELCIGGSKRSFCSTRLTVHREFIASILDNYSALTLLWEECLEERLQPDIKGRINGIQTQRRQNNLLFGLKLRERVLTVTHSLSKTLQIQLLSATESYHLAEMTCLILRGMKTEQAFDLFFQGLESLRHQV